MIAVITSTIFPQTATKDAAYRETIKSSERLSQTIETISSLTKTRFTEIFLFDNSHEPLDEETIQMLAPAKIFTFNMFQFRNKGLTEMHMLLAGLKYLPDNVNIFKISGRYQLSGIANTNTPHWDFAGKYDRQTRTISTRGYYIKNKALWEKVLLLGLNYIYAYQHRVVGPKSLLKIIKNAINPNLNELYYESSISIERGMGEAISVLGLNIIPLKHLNISGISGNPTDQRMTIHE